MRSACACDACCPLQHVLPHVLSALPQFSAEQSITRPPDSAVWCAPVYTDLLAPDRFRSMVAMLQEEVSSGMHAPGAILADPSAAVGLLWARRGLQFWIALFRPHVEQYLRTQRAAADAKADSKELSADTPAASPPATSTAPSLNTSPAGTRPSSALGGAPAFASPASGPGGSPVDLSAVTSTPTGLAGAHLEKSVTATLGELAEKAGGLRDSVGGFSQKLLSGVISPEGYAEALRAYSESIEPFNGWIARNTFTLTARATPDWASFGLKLAPTREALAEDVHLWSTAVSAVLQRMADMHRSFDLEDVRKTI